MRTLRRPLVAAALLLAACLNERALVPATTDTKVRMALRVNLQVSSAGERIVEIRARYRRANGEQPTLPVQPTQVTVADGVTVQQAVAIDIGSCNADPTRVSGEGALQGCLFTIELTLKNGAGETLGSAEEDVGPVGPGPAPSPTFVLSTPSLTVSPGNLAFSARVQQPLPTAQTVTVGTNNAGATLGALATSITYTTGQNWLRATVDQATHSVSIQPTTTALAVGTYSAVIGVTSSVDGMKPQTLPVTYQVSQLPVLTVTGGGDGGGTVTSSPAGISCTMRSGVTSGTCSAAFQPNASVTLTAAASDGDSFSGWSSPCSGTGSCVVTLAQGVSVRATFNAPVPVLRLSPTSLSFSAVTGAGNPARQTVAISNGGGGNLSGVVISSITYPGVPGPLWLDATISGSTITVGPVSTNLTPGTYSATIAVGSANGGSASIAVSYTINVRPPVLQLSPTSLSFAGTSGSASPARQNISIVNAGGGSLTGVTVSNIRYGGTEPAWLSATISGSTISVGATTGNLGAGNYSATVTVSSSNAGSATFTATFAVAPRPPVLSVTPTTMTFGALAGSTPPPPQTARASNVGAGTFADLGGLAVGPGLPTWLRVSFDGSVIVVTPAIAGLGGTLKGTVTIVSARGGSATIDVTINISILR